MLEEEKKKLNNSPKLREFRVSRARIQSCDSVENSKILHVSSSKRRIGCRNTRQQCITCLDSPTVSRTCIPDRYVTESEFDKKQISNSLWRIQPSTDAIRQVREIGREPIFLPTENRDISPRHTRSPPFLFTRLSCIFKEIRIKGVIVFSCFLNYYANAGFYPLFLFFLSFFFSFLYFVGDFDNSPWKRRLRQVIF